MGDNKPIKLTKKDFTKNGLKKIVNRDIDAINKLSDSDLISLYSFFKFLVVESDDEMIFATMRNTLVAKYREILKRKYGIKIVLAEEFTAM